MAYARASGVLGAALLLAASATLIRSPSPAAVTPEAPSGPRPAVPANDLARAAAEDTPLPVLTEDPAPVPGVAPDRAVLVDGPMEQILYAGAGSTLPSSLVGQALRLFGHKLDLTRDLALGDRVRLIVRGRAQILDFAELDGVRGPIRLYRIADVGDEADAFADDSGAPLRRLLLRTPLAHPRQTSSFGLRFHPLLGFTRMHEGVDFGAPVGTPVLAAEDGVVETVQWRGGYGRMVRLRHLEGFETLYGHLSAWAPGLTPNAPVRQGETIGWTGQSGLSTGPHLHFEVISGGRPIDPSTAVPPPPIPSRAQHLAFEARRQAANDLLAQAWRPPSRPVAIQ